MAGFKIQCTTTTPSESVELPFVVGGPYNGIVDWGDGSPLSTITAWDDVDATHTYAAPGTYTLELKGQFYGWSVNNTHSSKLQWTSIVYWGDSVDIGEWYYLRSGWYGCSNLTSMGTGKILGSTITDLYACWAGCNKITIIPDGILDNCTLVTNLSACWYNCSLLESIPNGLMRNCTLVTNLSSCFGGCNKAKFNPWMFYNDGEQATRFLNKSVNFTGCFNRSSFTGTQGQAPDLWKCAYGSGTFTKTNCFASAGNSLTSEINYNNIPSAWGGSGYVDTPPVITAVDKEIIGNGGKLSIDGNNFENSGGSLYVCDTNNLSDSTKVQIYPYSQSNTNIQILIAGISGHGTKYLYFVDSDNQISDSPWEIYSPGGVAVDVNKICDLAYNPILSGTTKQFIGYIEPEETSETLSLRMYNFLLHSIRQADSTREGAFFVKRLFEGPQTIWQTIHGKIFSIKNLWSITKCPDEALKYLKCIVGWTSELDYITNELDYNALRRLISTSVPLWRERGREETTLNVLSLVANTRCVIWNWFDYRWIIDETEFGENHQGRDSWMIYSPADGNSEEYYNTLRIVDDGTLNKTLVRNIIKLMRPCGERIEITYIDFMERFLVEDDISQWDAIDGSPIISQDGNGILNDSAYQLSVVYSEDSYIWNRYVFYCRIKGIGIGNSFGIVFYYSDSDNYYEILFNIDSSSDDYVLNKIVSGSSTLVTSGTITQKILDDIWYGVRLHIDVEGTYNRIKLYIDSSEIFNILDSSTLENGTIGFFSSASATAKLDECELFQLPLETELIDINS